MSRTNYSQLFSVLDETLQIFIQEVDNQKLQNMATDEWSVKDVLCHIVFWHRYYAQNYSALAKSEEPVVFTSMGGSTRNQEGVNSLKAMSKNDLIKLLHEAQQDLHESIVVKNVTAMIYTNRKKYSTDEFLDVIIRHIKGHTKQIIKAREIHY